MHSWARGGSGVSFLESVKVGGRQEEMAHKSLQGEVRTTNYGVDVVVVRVGARIHVHHILVRLES